MVDVKVGFIFGFFFKFFIVICVENVVFKIIVNCFIVRLVMLCMWLNFFDVCFICIVIVYNS